MTRGTGEGRRAEIEEIDEPNGHTIQTITANAPAHTEPPTMTSDEWQSPCAHGYRRHVLHEPSYKEPYDTYHTHHQFHANASHPQ